MTLACSPAGAHNERMGREAAAVCTLGAASEPVKALLESRELILRGPTIKRRFDLAALRDLRVAGDSLLFEADGEAVALELGEAEATKWRERASKPPPTLAAKLGIGPGAPAAVFGPVDDDAELAAALMGARTDRLDEATVLVAAVFSPDELADALGVHEDMPCPAIWVVHAKGGKSVALGDGAIRETLRARGYRDTKTSAVSALLTATRYVRP